METRVNVVRSENAAPEHNVGGEKAMVVQYWCGRLLTEICTAIRVVVVRGLSVVQNKREL
jgi:hypothetical protein